MNIGRGDGGQGSENWGAGSEGGGKLFAGCKLIEEPHLTPSKQCQIITFIILKLIAKLRLKLKSILLVIPSNKIKGRYCKLVHL